MRVAGPYTSSERVGRTRVTCDAAVTIAIAVAVAIAIAFAFIATAVANISYLQFMEQRVALLC